MTSKEIFFNQTFSKTILINASSIRIWEALTHPGLMKQWMSETEIDIDTDWQVGHPVTIGGDWYKSRFENKGVVLGVEPGRILSYSHLNSLSRLPDEILYYSILEFRLTPAGSQTSLTFIARNFPTETIYRHFAFYWNVALELLRKFAER